jgi:prepilin-type N-terminal cleavage/methylation domain-containing protein
MNQIRSHRLIKAFTLIELLVTIGIVTILMSITIVSINIGGQFKSAREAKRSSDVRLLLDSITQYIIDEKDTADIAKDNLSKYLSNGTYIPVGSVTAENVPTPNIDLCSVLIPKYIAQMPSDPIFDLDGSGSIDDCNNYHSGYMLTRSLEGRLTISAPYSESQPIIAVR